MRIHRIPSFQRRRCCMKLWELMPWEVSAAEIGDEGWVDPPVAPFLVNRHLATQKTVVQGQIVANSVFPSSSVLSEFREALLDKLVDLTQEQSLEGWTQYGPCNHCYISQRRRSLFSPLFCVWQLKRTSMVSFYQAWFSCFFHFLVGC